jgi:integrase
MPKLDYNLDAVNNRLREGKVPVRLKQRGSTISLRATLPPPPAAKPTADGRQIIALGLPANEAGFKQAELKAKELGLQMVQGKFDWAMWLSEKRLVSEMPASIAIAEFETENRAIRKLKDATWDNHWLKYLKRLPQDKPVDTEILLKLALETQSDSHARKECCNVLQAFADFLELKIDLKKYRGNYGGAKVKDRDLPTDEEIAYWYTQIPNEAWRWIYGILASHGLRPHESFFSEWSKDGLWVQRGKTGRRLVYEPLYPEWVEQWGLADIKLPNITVKEDDYDDLGCKITRQFKRYGIPFTAYDLRHAWAIRASVTFGFPVTTAAALLGHSPEIHLSRYHKHISLAQNRIVTARLMGSADRPKAPAPLNHSN